MVNQVNNKNIVQPNQLGDNFVKNLESYIEEKRTNRQKEDIWFNDMSVLFDSAYVFEFIPTASMTFGEKINAITRFAFFLSIILVVLKSNYIYLYVFIIPVIITYIVYIFSAQSKEFFQANNSNSNSNINLVNTSTTDDELTRVMEKAIIECQEPSDDNPLMNVLPTDNFQTRKPACNINEPQVANDVSNKITDTYVEKLYCDTTNLINRNIGERDFYTMPNTRVPHDQGTFAKWLYETPVSCSTGNIGELKQHRACAYTNKSLDELKIKLEYEKIPNEVPRPKSKPKNN
jgi:hypothetical protein